MSNTPRTDAEEYWDNGEEEDVVPSWLARVLERELAFAKNAVLDIREWTPEQWKDICTIARPHALWISGEQMDRLMELEAKSAT